ncbi:MAG: general negative regulator of transcription subunit 5 [Thelocarpon impressellum]|nr:MAG: general negative regulator of transcription subunit 5 [Thelocarpon impressellum]
MAQRKLQQEVDRCFKRVAEGIQAFEGIFDKIQQTSNQAQKEKLEDALKREIKKLQRQRDQIKTWAASNEIKDKKPLLEQRKLIETQMEKFKAVEKEMKTKAYSKEGLSAAAKLDPKEKEKLEACQFLSTMVEELERQIETVEAEAESLQATMKKGKKDTSKADRIAEVERITERHKWHQGKLELILRSLENGGVETEQVTELEESIRYYVDNNQDVDFMEDDAIYDDLNLEEEEDAFGLNNDNDRLSSQDTQSIQDDAPETEGRGAALAGGKSKSSSVSEPPGAAARRPSMHTKSPLPALATLHNPSTSSSNGIGGGGSMKPAPLPTRAPGETLKYASAAAAAAASDKNGVGIAPLPPPPDLAASTVEPSSGVAPLPSAGGSKSSSASALPSQPVTAGVSGQPRPAASGSATATEDGPTALTQTKAPAAGLASATAGSSVPSGIPQAPARAKADGGSTHLPRAKANDLAGEQAKGSGSRRQAQKKQAAEEARARTVDDKAAAQTNGAPKTTAAASAEPHESVYHLPPGLQDLVQSFEATRNRVSITPTPSRQRLLAASHANCPDPLHAGKPRHYRPTVRYNTAPHYPQEPLPTLDDHRLYSRVDTDTLFYVFYYRQGTYQQYLAAKALKNQSWRFHKQYQTWFQRHEEPKTITEEYEQGTYRFFDYESTWMNRRKADFKFAYKFLEDDL